LIYCIKGGGVAKERRLRAYYGVYGTVGGVGGKVRPRDPATLTQRS